MMTNIDSLSFVYLDVNPLIDISSIKHSIQVVVEFVTVFVSKAKDTTIMVSFYERNHPHTEFTVGRRMHTGCLLKRMR